MAKNNNQKKEPTQRDFAKKTLESKFWQKSFATSIYESSIRQGQRGSDPLLTGSYNEFFESKEVSKRKDEIYKERLKQYQDAGIVGEPSMPSSGDIEYANNQDVINSLQLIGMKDLYDIMTGLNPSIRKYSLPEKGLELSLMDIQKEAIDKKAIVDRDGQKAIDFEKLGQDYQEAFETLQTLQKFYGQSCQESLRIGRMETNFENMSKERNERYHPKPKETSE